MAKRYFYDYTVNGFKGLVFDTNKKKVTLYYGNKKVATRDYNKYYGKNSDTMFDRDLKIQEYYKIETDRKTFENLKKRSIINK